jgi:hypothetical protein
MPQPDENRIRERAYQIWQQEGRPEGREHMHWQMAVAQLAAEQPQDNSGAKPSGPGGGGEAGERGGSGPMPDVAPASVSRQTRKPRTRSTQKGAPRE